jgi:DnaJ-class molecular chaperone
MQDHYKTLDVNTDASQADIKKYRGSHACTPHHAMLTIRQIVL